MQKKKRMVSFLGTHALTRVSYLAVVFSLLSQLSFASENQIDLLKSRLLKVYDSSNQSLFQPDYFDVTIKHCEVNVTNVPKSESSSIFMLVEQAISTFVDRPYRIRFVKLKYDQATDTYLSVNFEPENPRQWSGTCYSDEVTTVDYQQFSDAKCTIELKKIGDDFVGSTPEQGCKSEFNGATVFRSRTTISDGKILSWDQGFDDFGNQVWGAVKGPYQFVEVTLGSQNPDVVEITSLILGERSNIDQVNADSSFSRVDYQICPVTVEGQTSGLERYAFAEQDILLGDRSIKRVRLYEFKRGVGNDILFNAYEVEDEAIFYGLCETARPALESISRNQVNWASDCQMNFQTNAIFTGKTGFFGMTPVGGCEASFRGSKYFTSSEVINEDSILVLERWWDENGKQVAGSTKGPYDYKRLKNYFYELP